MTALTIPCANPGCPNPRRDTSKYCCVKCTDTAHNARKKERRMNDPFRVPVYRVEHKPPSRLINNVHTRRRVEIRDDKCGDPYWITKTELERNADVYLHMDGLHVFIDGKPYEKQLVLI